MTRKRIVCSALAVVLLCTGCSRAVQTPASHYVMVKGHKLTVTEAKTMPEQERGLGGVTSLDDDHGMLFIFPDSALRTFWMKDMLMSIDIIWIREGAIVGIEDSVPAPTAGEQDTALPLYHSPETADHVLETAAGFSKRKGIGIGDRIEYH